MSHLNGLSIISRPQSRSEHAYVRSGPARGRAYYAEVTDNVHFIVIDQSIVIDQRF